MVKPTLSQKLGAEFLGTYFLVFTVGLVSLVGSSDASLKVFGGFAISSVLMVLVYSLGTVSGAHLNPAVTFAFFCQKEMEFKAAMQYMGVQVGGGALAGLSVGLMYGFHGSNIGPPASTGAQFLIGAPLVEFLYTVMLCFVVLNVACGKSDKTIGEGENPNAGKDYFGVAIGFVIVAGAYAAGPISGGCFNPAVAIGMMLTGASWHIFWAAIYIPVHLCAGFCSVTLFHLVRPEMILASEDTNFFLKIAHKIEKMFDPEDTSEFIGTFYLCLTISLNAMAEGARGTGGNPAGVWSIAACLMSMIYAVGDISGGIFNPALTIAFCCRFFKTGDGLESLEAHGMKWHGDKSATPTKLVDPDVTKKEVTKYLLAQFLGGAAGCGMTLLIFIVHGIAGGGWPIQPIGPQLLPPSQQPDQKNPTEHYGRFQAFFAEIVGTFILCFVVLAVVSTKKSTHEKHCEMKKKEIRNYNAFAIGACIVAGGYGVGPMSGGVLNPAVTIATSVCARGFPILSSVNPLLYFIAEVLGGILAALAFRLGVYAHEFEVGYEDKAAPLTSSEALNPQPRVHAPYSAAVTQQPIATAPYSSLITGDGKPDLYQGETEA
jgi:aquaporin Z